jgi:uncharacterized protein
VISTGDLLALVLAGFGAGLVGTVAGLASLISYPVLLAVGLPPVAANVTNTVALVFSGVGSALGSRPELRGQGPRLLRLGTAAVLGGLAGGALLLLTPSESFAAVVPVLLALASAMILFAPPPSDLQRRADARDGFAMTGGMFLVAVYGGYFGAAAGVMMLALLLIASGETLVRSIAAKNLLLFLANGVAAVMFVLAGPVRWDAVLPLAVGFFVGGRVGPAVARRAPARPLRILVGLAGLVLAAVLGVDAYRG